MSWALYGHPDDSGTDPESGTATTESPQAAAEPPEAAPVNETKPDLLAQAQAELAAARKETAELQERFLRKAAEFDNFRKRTEREKSDLIAMSKASALTELLPVLDACERARTSFQSEEAGESLARYREGVELLFKQLTDTLSRLGVKPTEALGQKFDPNLHEALVREESSEHEENTVIEVLRRGYTFHGRLLRPAQVKVAVRRDA